MVRLVARVGNARGRGFGVKRDICYSQGSDNCLRSFIIGWYALHSRNTPTNTRWLQSQRPAPTVQQRQFCSSLRDYTESVRKNMVLQIF